MKNSVKQMAFIVKTYFNIVLPFTPKSSMWHLSFRFPHQNPVRNFIFLLNCGTSPSIPILHDLKICQHLPISVKIGQSNIYFSRRCRYICLWSLAMLVFITQIASFLFYISTVAEETVFLIEIKWLVAPNIDHRTSRINRW